MRPLAAAGLSDYRNETEQKAIAEHRRFINEQMALARDAPDGAQRSQHLANAVAANGMLLRGMSVGFVTGQPDYRAINDLSAGVRTIPAFRSLMEDGSGERLAQSGSVDALVRELEEREKTLSQGELQSRPASDVIRDVQVKVRARTAQPRDYATLAAAHRLSSWKGKARAPDGKLMDVVRRDMNRLLDGGMLAEETERVLADPDFQYLIGHEKPESLGLNALRANGAALEQYARRAEQLRGREMQRARNAPKPAETEAAPKKAENGPVR